jgi:acetate kinase
MKRGLRSSKAVNRCRGRGIKNPEEIDAVGHRVVHGAEHLQQPLSSLIK